MEALQRWSANFKEQSRHSLAVQPCRRPNLCLRFQAKGTVTAISGPSWLACLLAQAAWQAPVGVHRGTRAPDRSARPPSWLTVVG